MTHIAYGHAATVPLVIAMTNWIRQTLSNLNRSPIVARPERVWPRRVFVILGWLVAVVVQCALLWLVAELVEVAHALMGLWLDLANQQLDLVQLYNAVRPE